MVDYTFHMILADPTEVTLKEHVPALVAQGHATLKVFMTYDRLQVGDEQLLDVLLAAREQQGAGVRARREPRHDLVDGQAAGREGLHGAEVPHHQPPARLARPRPSTG